MLDGSLTLTFTVPKSKIGVTRYNLYPNFLSSYTIFHHPRSMQSVNSDKKETKRKDHIEQIHCHSNHYIFWLPPVALPCCRARPMCVVKT